MGLEWFSCAKQYNIIILINIFSKMLYSSMYWLYKFNSLEVLNLLNKPKLFACSTSGIFYDNEVVAQKQEKNNTDKI